MRTWKYEALGKGGQVKKERLSIYVMARNQGEAIRLGRKSMARVFYNIIGDRVTLIE